MNRYEEKPFSLSAPASHVDVKRDHVGGCLLVGSAKTVHDYEDSAGNRGDVLAQSKLRTTSALINGSLCDRRSEEVAIYDEFSSCSDVSRTRRYKLRHQHARICIYYAESAVMKFHCSSRAAIRFQFLRTTTRLVQPR